MQWKRGEVAVLRELHCGRVYSGRAGQVVLDAGDEVSIYFAADTVCQWPTAGGRALRIPEPDWELKPGGWLPYHQLHLMRRDGISHVTVLFDPASGEHAGWKVDFHERAQRTALGFDALDWALDIMVTRDNDSSLKDQDEYASYQEQGLLSPQDAEMVAKELERLLAQIRQHQAPFDDSFKDWRPDPEWIAVPLPVGWDSLS